MNTEPANPIEQGLADAIGRGLFRRVKQEYPMDPAAAVREAVREYLEEDA